MIDYDEPGVLGLFQRIASVFTRELFDRFRGLGNPSLRPVFVLGMPRSGSTLVEQILASHPSVHGAGELTDLEKAVGPRLLQFPGCVPSFDAAAFRQIGNSYIEHLPPLTGGQVRTVNKLPHNFLYVGLIRLIFPNARIVHTMRNPIDTCVSCYSNLFTTGQPFTYDMPELGRYYRGYRTLMAHWHSVLPPECLLDVSYEDVVDDIEGQSRRLIDFCGLPWDARCVSFHKTSRPVQTASAVQVRQPLFRSSLQRWRRYEFGIGPLLAALGDILPRGGPTLDSRAMSAAHI